MPFLLLSKTVRRLVGVVVLLGVLAVGGTAAGVWWTARGDDRRASDAIVVLGAAQFDGRPSSVLEARLEHAKTLFGEGVAPRILTVGGSRPGDRFTEAAAGERYLVGEGVPAKRILAVQDGRDTLESLQALADVLTERGWTSVVLVTDPWHVLRSERMARDAGIDAVSSPTRRGPAVRTREVELRYIARETAAYLFYRAFGRSAAEGAPGAL